MTVQELIAQLSAFDPSTPVHIAYDYGDYWHTMVAPLTTGVDQLYIKPSDRLMLPILAFTRDGDDDRESATGEAVVIHAGILR